LIEEKDEDLSLRSHFGAVAIQHKFVCDTIKIKRKNNNNNTIINIIINNKRMGDCASW